MALNPAYPSGSATSVGVDDLQDGSVIEQKLAEGAVAEALERDGGLTRDGLASAAGMTFNTRAALFEPGIAGSMQRVSFSFDPTNGTDLTVRFKRRGLSLPAASETRHFTRASSSSGRPGIAYINTAGVYVLEMREASTALASYTWTDDREEHEWEFRYTSTGCTIFLDGVSVASGVTAPTFLDTSYTHVVGAKSTDVVYFDGDHATYRDFEVIDPVTATNKVYLRLDEGAGGPYRNAYLTPGDPLYEAGNTSGVEIATTGTNTALPKSVEVSSIEPGAAPVIAGGRTARMRQAAFGGLGDHATAGQFGNVSWAPSGTPAFNVEIDCARSITQAGTAVLWGWQNTQYANIIVTTAGVVQARVNATSICKTTVAALPNDGRLRTLRVEFRDSGADVTAAIYVNRKLLVSGTLAATQFSAAPGTQGVGGANGARRYGGIISRVLMEDLNSATNSAEYLMTERTGDYANTYSGGTLAALTRNGYVGCCAVESEDGKGTPWQMGSGGPLVYGARRSSTPQVLDGSASAVHALTFNTELEDPTGALNPTTGVWTAPAAGRVSVDVRFELYDSTAENITVGAYVTGVAQNTIAWDQPLTTALERVYGAGFSVVAGDTVDLRISGIEIANTALAHRYSYIRITFTPDPATG